MNDILIVGGGQAAVEAAATLRAQGFAGRVRILADEPEPPYQRPPLSKQLLAGKIGFDKTHLRAAQFYPARDIELHLGTRASGIDREARRVRLESGQEWPYDRLLVATGARARRLDIGGIDLRGVHYLRSVADTRGIAEELRPGARVVVIGGGYIGLEVAATARALGCEVLVAELAEALMARQVAAELGSYFEQRHRREGVDIRTGCGVSAIEGRERVEAVVLNEAVVPADMVVVGVGIVPNVDWLEGTGLATAQGLPVDSRCRTRDPLIFGAGDVTLQTWNGAAMRIESVQNAVHQGRAAALAIMDQPAPPAVPWFWSDQYELKLQMAGIPGEGDVSLIRRFDQGMSVVYLHGEVVRAVHVVGNAKEFMAAKKLIQRQTAVDLERLADPQVALKELL